jgi:DNA-binding HxlR family transcriptional regulator
MSDLQAPKKRPIVELLELLGQRWTLRLLWEFRAGPLTFRALSEACGGVPSASLNARVQELRRAGIVQQTDSGYDLTARGRKLGESLLELSAWANTWKEAGSWRAERPRRKGAR